MTRTVTGEVVEVVGDKLRVKWSDGTTSIESPEDVGLEGGGRHE